MTEETKKVAPTQGPPQLGEPGEHPMSVLLFSWMRSKLFFRLLMAGLAGLGAFLAACGDSGSSSGETEMRSVTTPLGTYDIPVNPKRVVAIDSRLDLEPAVALELPLVGYTYAHATPWVPIDSSVPFLSEIPNREQILALEPDLIVCLNYESEWWPVASTT